MIVTIDGPAGAGKSSAARELAKRLGFRFLDTGAMYRAVTLAARERGLDLAGAAQLAQLVRTIRVELAGDRVLLDGKDVTAAIRKFDITTAIHHAADNAAVREQLVIWQRQAAAGGDVVTEGRDQGTVVFPHAECKIFLIADEQERARRRHRDLLARGEEIPFEEVLANQRLRDQRDQSRPVGALRKAADAIEVSTDGLSPDEVVLKLERIVRSKQSR
ncbi:MAG TPA: (d)CMP kinase [Lacipirellulaceae bacterium]|nr:(d)CMP kinase [Lacipirellulaceae bacterium]